MGIGIRSDVRSRVGTWERPWTIDKKLGPTYTIRTAKRKEPELPVLPSTIYMEPASSVGRRGRSCGLLQMTARCDACTQAVNWLLQAACSTGSNATCCHMCACFAIGKACLGKVSHGSESRFIPDRTSPPANIRLQRTRILPSHSPRLGQLVSSDHDPRTVPHGQGSSVGQGAGGQSEVVCA